MGVYSLSGGAFLQRRRSYFLLLTIAQRFSVFEPSSKEQEHKSSDQERRQHTPWAGGENNAQDREQLVLENLPRTVRCDCRRPSRAHEANVQERRGDYNDKVGFIDPTQGVERPIDPC